MRQNCAEKGSCRAIWDGGSVSPDMGWDRRARSNQGFVEHEAVVGTFQERHPLDLDDHASETDQDRGEGGAALEVRDFPTGGGGGAERTVRGDPATDQANGNVTSIGRARVCLDAARAQSRTDELREAAHINRQSLRASPWLRCGMRFSGKGEWQPRTENPLGRKTRGARCQNGSTNGPGSAPGLRHIGNVG
jgi:hypothetical protein